MFDTLNLKDDYVITSTKLGEGSFGFVYLCFDKQGKSYAIKGEKKGEGNSLLKEFKLSMRIYNVKKFLETQGDYMLNHETIIIYNYITKNDMLSIPSEFIPNIILKENYIPKPYTYFEGIEHNFLTMDLCGDNFEKIIKNYKLTEKCKYFIAKKLLHIMCCFHRCGIIHRDMKLANIVLNKKISEVYNVDELSISLIDMGLAKEYYVYEGEQIKKNKSHEIKSIIGTVRYLSLNVHAFNSPTIIDDLIGLTYVLINIFTQKHLPWVGHKKDVKKFDKTKHTDENCKCKYHRNLKHDEIQGKNTISEIKYHINPNDLCKNYTFLKKWLSYLYSLNINALPNYTILLNYLMNDINNLNLKNLSLEFEKLS
jgi:serine/threonine protein kinase